MRGCISLPTGGNQAVTSHLRGPLMWPQKAVVKATWGCQELREPILALPSSG